MSSCRPQLCSTEWCVWGMLPVPCESPVYTWGSQSCGSSASAPCFPPRLSNSSRLCHTCLSPSLLPRPTKGGQVGPPHIHIECCLFFLSPPAPSSQCFLDSPPDKLPCICLLVFSLLCQVRFSTGPHSQLGFRNDNRENHL